MWIWSKLSGAQWQDAWEERFYGNPNSVINLLKGGKSLRVEVYCETEKEAKAIQEQFGGSMRKLANQNWAAMTTEVRPPINIRGKILVTGEKDAAKLKVMEAENSALDVISIPPDMAFGTGDHATTSTCMRLLVDVSKERKGTEWDFLDLGTGSGLLAIAAMKLGAQSAFGCDYDPLAVKVAKNNIIANGTPEVELKEFDVLDWVPPQQWKVVAANLFCDVLQAGFPMIIQSMADDGDLLISGILADQWEPTKEAGESAGLTFSEVKKRGKWVTARGRKD